MTEPTNLPCRRRIDQLKVVAYACNLTNDEARTFGKLSATATWEKLLLAHGLEFDRKSETEPLDTARSSQEPVRQVNFLEWVDFGQLIAVALASAGLVVMILSLFPKINPLNLFPVKITIQVGVTK